MSNSILIVGEDAPTTDLSAALREAGFSVGTAVNGPQALLQIQQQKPRLIILELALPELPGEEVVRIIKKDQDLQDIFIIVLSDKDDLESKLNCLNAGAEEYLVKPIATEELVVRVRRVLQLINRFNRDNVEAEPAKEFKTSPTIHISLSAPPADSVSSSVSEPAAVAQPRQKAKSKYGVYRIESLAGKGGMGLVYKAFDEVLDRSVAVKVLSEEWSTWPEFLERFHREAKLIAAINHPAIAQIYTFGQEDGQCYFALQWCPGGSIATLIRQEGAVDLLRAVDIILQCARGLETAALKGVVHRDIKPSNLMFDENHQIKILDFGVAFSKALPEQKNEPTRVLGSPPYMAPEQASGSSTDYRGDMYSLGITFYQMLYGRLPFSANSALEWVDKHKKEPFPAYDDVGGKVPLKAYRIIEKLTQKDPAARYQKYSELIRDLEKLRNELYTQKRLKIPSVVESSATPVFKGENFFDALAFVSREQKSGLLTVKMGRLWKRILILRHDIVHFESPQPDDNVWLALSKKALMRKEDIPSSEEDLEESLNRLLSVQAFSPEVFQDVYREVMTTAVMNVFRWPICEAQFFESSIEHNPLARISIPRILMDAARQLVRYEAMVKAIPEDHTIVRSKKIDDILPLVDLRRLEFFLVSRLEDANLTLQTLQILTNFSLEDVSRIVYPLERLGALEFRSPDESRRLRTAELAKRRQAGSVSDPRITSKLAGATSDVIEVRRTKRPWIDGSGEWKKETRTVDITAAARYYDLAIQKYESGQYWESERLAGNAVKNNPSVAKYHHLLALSMSHHTRSANVAEDCFRQAIKLEPENMQFRVDLAYYLWQRGRVEVAISECQKVLEISPGDQGAISLLKEMGLQS